MEKTEKTPKDATAKKTEEASSGKAPEKTSEPISAKDRAKDAVKNVDFSRKLNAIVSSIFSRCGVPIADFSVSEPVSFYAKVSYCLNWSFKCRATDKHLRRVSDETKVLSSSALDEFTQNNSKELEKESAVTKSFIKRLAEAKFNELADISGQIVAFNRVAAIGKTRCKTCHGSKKSSCESCLGKGTVPCPACHGTGSKCNVCNGAGTVKCAPCNGEGSLKCRNCEGTGELTVEREIIYDAECKKQVSINLTVPGSDIPITSFSKEDEKAILAAANFEDQSSGQETPHGYVATFAGFATCFAVHVKLKDNKKPFDFILCGKNLRPICKPPILNVVFNYESQLLADTLSMSQTDVDEKIDCVKALASKAILAKTIRSIESYEMQIVKAEAVKQGVTVESILWDAKKNENARAKLIKNNVKEELLESVKKELINNAEGFISDDFARYFAKNLIAFVPMLMILNPNTKMVWAGITLGTWMLMIVISYFVPNAVGAFLGMGISVAICMFTSLMLTKNWAYYSVVSTLRLTHKLKKVPNLTVEAVQSGRLLIGSLVIGVASIIIFNSGF